MKFLRFSLAAVAMCAALAFASLAPVHAQVGPGGSIATAPTQHRTYRATTTALVPAGAATDLFTIAGPATGQAVVRFIHCDATADGAQNVLLSVIRRSTLDTVGTSTTPTAIPLNSTYIAAAAVLKAYTANPTLGTTVAALAAGQLSSAAASPAFNNAGVNFDFTDQNAFLNSATQQIAVNANATTFNNNSKVNCWMEWSEQ